MNGRILAGQQNGAHVIKLTGDVRLTLCAALEDYLEHMFEDSGLQSVTLNLHQAEGIDSTTLGILARMALRARGENGFKPVICSCDASINRLLESMAFDQIFDIRKEDCSGPDPVSELPTVLKDTAQVKQKVIEAHGALMDLSEQNRLRFQDLVTSLRRSQQP